MRFPGLERARCEVIEENRFFPSSKKTGRWRPWKRMFQRTKQHQQPACRDRNYLPKESDEQDHHTANLSFSGSNFSPYSLDETFDSLIDRLASQSDRNNTFAQSDLSTMHSSHTTSLLNTSMNTSISSSGPSDYDSEPSFSVMDQLSLADSTPLITTDQGTEVVLSNKNDKNKDDIFLSFMAAADVRHEPLYTNASSNPFTKSAASSNEVKRLNVQPKYSAVTRLHLPPNSSSVILKNQSSAISLSPDLSSCTSESLTWVSHDDDDGDKRPVKEIEIPTLTRASMDDLFLDNETFEVDFDSMPLRQHSIRSADFGAELSKCVPERKNTNCLESWSPHRLKSSLSAFSSPPCFSNKPDTLTRESKPDREPVTTTDNLYSKPGDWEGFFESTAPIPPPPPESTPQRSLSSAFLKQKSALSGEDLLSHEAECFAEFLEEGQKHDALPSPIRSTPPSSHKMSPEQRLLFAMKLSMDASDDEEAFTTPSCEQSYSDFPVETSLDRSYVPVTIVNSAALDSYVLDTPRSAAASNTKIFMTTKSVSSDSSSLATPHDEYTTDAASSSSSAASTSYALSTVPGNVKYGGRNPDYCGGMFSELDDDDDLTLSSEECSIRERRSIKRRTGRKETRLLDQVRMDLLDTVQEMAREGSTVVMNFLQKK